MGKAKKAGNFHFVETKVGTYAIALSSETDPMSTFLNGNVANWDGDPISVAGERIIPWGAKDNLPLAIRNILEKNNLGPGILRRKAGLLYGQGPALYRNKIENNERVQEWVEDNEIQDWLESWDYKKFVRDAFVEYNHMDGVFAKYFSAKSVRIKKPWITRLECLSSKDCRLVAPPEEEMQRLENVRFILTGDFERYKNLLKYPVFDKWDPTKTETAIKYHCLRSFGRNMYAISSFYGSMPWMHNANDIPEIISILNKNMIAGAYMVHAPAAYWNKKKEQIEEMHPEWADDQVMNELEILQDEIVKKISDVMAGKRNAGKFFSCVDFTDDAGNKQEWKIEPIEMNVDKYIEAQAKVSTIADSSTTSGFGLNPALANIIIDGKGDSGSQMLYALKIFFGADTQIPEDIALEAINDAIRINFPEKKGIFLGLYRKVINKEDNVTASKRATNQA